MRTITVTKRVVHFSQVPLDAVYYHMGNYAVKVSTTHAKTRNGLEEIAPSCFVTLYAVPSEYFGEELNVRLSRVPI